MAEAPLVTFEDQDHKRRRLQLHDVQGGLRVNLAAALTNFEAVSFSRQTDGLVLEVLPGSEFSSLTFTPDEVVRLDVVRRSADAPSPHVVKMLLEEIEHRGLHASGPSDDLVRRIAGEMEARFRSSGIPAVPRIQYADDGTPQQLQPELQPPLQADGVTADQADNLHDAQGQNMLLVGLPTHAAPSPPAAEYNSAGKKRRFCGACTNHNLKIPLTFQHQQVCPYRTCSCALCVKKRAISAAQAEKRHARKAGTTQQQSTSVDTQPPQQPQQQQRSQPQEQQPQAGEHQPIAAEHLAAVQAAPVPLPDA